MPRAKPGFRKNDGGQAAPAGAVLEGGARAAVVGVLGDDAQTAIRVGEVANHGVLVDHRPAGAVALVVDGEPGVAGGAIDLGRRFWRFGFGYEKTSFCTCVYVRQEALRMPSGCAALPAKKTTDAEGSCMRLGNRTMPSAARRRRRRKSLRGFTKMPAARPDAAPRLAWQPAEDSKGAAVRGDALDFDDAVVAAAAASR